MKISHVTTRIVSTPGDSPLVFDQPPTASTFDFVTLETPAGMRTIRPRWRRAHSCSVRDSA